MYHRAPILLLQEAQAQVYKVPAVAVFAPVEVEEEVIAEAVVAEVETNSL